MDAAEVTRRSSASSSPEFEFWPLHPDPAASPSCADELFAGGVLLPLHVLPQKPASSHGGKSSSGHGAPPPELETEAEPGEASILATVARPTASITSPAPPASTGGSKRWTDIFSKKPSPPAEDKEKEKEKRKDGTGGRKQMAHGGSGGGGGGGSELNINIWPFSRSRSAGGGSGSSSKPRPPARKVSSAPCSRSNSRGEAGGPPRRWAASPGRAGGGVPVGRSSPVWQIRRPAARPAPAAPSASELAFADRRAAPPPPQTHREKSGAATAGGGRKPGLGGGVRGLNLSVNSCIGYRHQVSCRRADVGAARVHGGGGGLFGIKGFFSKKVH
ncbi:unnamed protein product [Urochloa decumbens]|uniref:Uncharacterized protein n=1 Tax=Urochloa decumbens TaxID=240449 RepID=A0ABC9AU05_9POAL